MIEYGDYDSLKGQLDSDIASEKRDYSVLKPDGQSPTVMTIADDFVHYRVPRAITVREMARLQSFDDSFVFQGKRTTGGHRRKEEIPQCTLVGNAVPPLMARAIATTLLHKL
jgi:DNA (cytosine-5)-methyltransferase 1